MHDLPVSPFIREMDQRCAAYNRDMAKTLISNARECDPVKYPKEAERRQDLVRRARSHNHSSIWYRKAAMQ